MCGVRSVATLTPHISGLVRRDDVMEDVATAEYSITSREYMASALFWAFVIYSVVCSKYNNIFLFYIYVVSPTLD